MENNKINVSGSNGNNDIFITTSQNSENITVDTNRSSISINATNNNALHYSNKAKEWAEKSEESAKESKESADKAENALNQILNNEDLKKVSANEENINKVANDIENVNFVGENIEDITELVTSLENLGDTTNINIVASNIDRINSLAEDIQTVEENKNIVLSQVDVAIEQAEISTNQANISIAQATISTTQATKSENNANLSYQYSQNAKDKADICIENASICEEQALISKTQANISTTQANNSLNYSKNAKTSEENALIYSNNAKLNADVCVEKASIVNEKTDIAIEKSNNAKIWAEGTDSEVQALGGVHSAKGWAEIGGSGSDIDESNLVHKDGTETITGAKSFTGAVNLIGSGDTNAVGVGTNTRFNVHNTNKTVLGFGNNLFYINHGDYRLRLRGKDTRPHYNSDTNYLALLSDIPNISNLATKDEVNAKQDKGDYVTSEQAEVVLQTKQDVLTAGENIEIVDNIISAKGGSSNGFNLFDTKLSDHILEGDEAKGWALQGTYVYKEAVAGSRDGYPTFYDDVLIKKQNATATEVTLGDSTITMYITNNGYQFYDIADREVIDNWYNTYGLAWFYGVDEANERVFLPRDKYFALKGIAPVVGNGMTLGLMNDTQKLGLSQFGSGTTRLASTGTYGQPAGTKPSGGESTFSKSLGVTTEIGYSGIEAHLVPNEEKYLYICVGNTNVKTAVTDIVDVTTTENDTVPLFTGMYFDFNPNNVSWLKAGEQVNSGDVYTTAYNELVNCLNGVNKYNLKVINTADMVADVDYSEYWKVNQDELYFITPTKLSYGALTGGVLGDGTSLGLTDGTNEVGLFSINRNNYPTLAGDTGAYGLGVGTNVNSLDGNTAVKYTVGITQDVTKSGIIAEQSIAELYFKVANAVQNLELINVGEITESLADKIGRQDCPAYIVEVSDKSLLPSWYRVYSDGWCEQGGRSSATSNLVVVNLLKPFIDTNYSVITTGLYDGGNTANAWDYVRNFTTSTFSIYQQEDGCVWEAKGYIS